MKNRILVIDDFYKDPEKVRDIFLDTPKSDDKGNLAGEMSSMYLYDESLRKLLSQIVGHQVDSGYTTNGKARFTKKDDTFKQHIHFDAIPKICWAGVVYLTPDHLVPDLQNAGTKFWTHKEKQIFEVPHTVEEAEQKGFMSYDDSLKFLNTDGIDESKWETNFIVPWKFNRLVLFRPWVFHSPGIQFGDKYNNCRMVQTFFLRATHETL